MVTKRTEEISELVRQALVPVLGADVVVQDVRALTAGASRQSWRIEAGPADGPMSDYVLQREAMPRGEPVPLPGGGSSADFAPLPMSDQAAVMRAAFDAGVPVPRVVASGATDQREWVLCEFLEGEALPPKLLRDPALEKGVARLTEDSARALATIHGLDPAGLGLRQQDKIAIYRTRLDHMGEPRPVLELAYRWLAEHRPPPRPPVVVHGDFRLGNLLVGPGGLAAVLDWELVHLGDPHEDVAWATIRAWRFDRHRPEDVFPHEESWVAAYNDAVGAGREVDPEALRWWQIAGTWSWAVISAMQARRHLDGWMHSLEHAVIGRRVAESEWDLLELLP
jgi:aminoglycoside phosphotransferase (APT) family kinase protein